MYLPSLFVRLTGLEEVQSVRGYFSFHTEAYLLVFFPNAREQGSVLYTVVIWDLDYAICLFVYLIVYLSTSNERTNRKKILAWLVVAGAFKNVVVIPAPRRYAGK